MHWFVRSTGTALKVKGVGSADFAGSGTFQDVPKEMLRQELLQLLVVTTATTALEDQNYLTKDKTNAANNVDSLHLSFGPVKDWLLRVQLKTIV